MYYGEYLPASPKPYTVPAAQLQVTVISIGEPDEDKWYSGGLYHSIWEYPVTVFVRGTCRSPKDYLNPSRPQQVTRLDEEEAMVMLKNDDGTFDVSEINGRDAHTGSGSSWVCD